MLTLSKVVVEVGNHADAARAGDYRLEPGAAPEAYVRSDYQLSEQGVERRPERGSASLWLGADDALAQFGVQRGQALERDDLIAVLQGQHAQSGEQLRRPGALKREARDEHETTLLDAEGRPVVEKVTGVAHVEMTLSVPKSVSVLWAMADQDDRRRIEQAMLAAAERTVQYMARNKAVVHRRGKDGTRLREPAAGAAVASSLHVTARRARGDRAPAPQLHVHNLVVGVVRSDGLLVAADSWEWFRHDAALEGGALFRVQVADALAEAGWEIRSGTGDRGRYFEVQGVPERLCEVMSPRSREVAEARAKVERELGIRLQGGALAVLAKETRQAKDHGLDPDRLREVWDALGQEHGFGPGCGSRLRGRPTGVQDLEARMIEAERVVLARLREQGPTVGLARARALVFEAAAGRLSADDAARLLAQLDDREDGLLTLEGSRVTSREIHRLEHRVIDVAITAAGREAQVVSQADQAVARRAAEAALGDGGHLDAEQRQAFQLLCGGAGWACLTGRAGTGKGPVLHAAAEAYRAAGCQVLACAMDGTTARRMAEQLGGTTPALTIEQLKTRLKLGILQVDERTVIFVDEASKLDTDHWGELAAAVEEHAASVRAIGHAGQHDAIRLAGLFSAMLADPRIPTAQLRQIRRHRDPDNPAGIHPWLRDYQIAVDQGRGPDAVAILQEQDALRLHDTRGQAMGALVDEWDQWRHDYQPTESALIVHGPNPDVDLVNELAQRKRLDAGELGGQAIRAVDREYLLRPGDVVAVRNAPYTLPAQPRQSRPERIENGQTAVVEAVDPQRDTLTLLVREPGTEPRTVQIDQAHLRAEHAAGNRTAAIRLNYALHSFPAQGATLRGTATLAGHWSQAKQETYVGDTRAIYRHTVHIAREDLGTNGTDQDRIDRYAHRISHSRQRHASIRCRTDLGVELGVDLPADRPIPFAAVTANVPQPNEPPHSASVSTRKTELAAVTAATAGDAPPDASPVWVVTPPRAGQERQRPDGQPERLVRALGPVPVELVARERWHREARRLEGLGLPTSPKQQPAGPPATDPSNKAPAGWPGPIPSSTPSRQHDGPTIGR